MALLPPPPAKHKGLLAVGVVVLVLSVFRAVLGSHGLIDLLRLQHHQSELEQVAFQLQQRNEQLRDRVRRLQSDDIYIEKLARERLGLVKKGEIVYRANVSQPATPDPH